jgi:hypothetical protein
VLLPSCVGEADDAGGKNKGTILVAAHFCVMEEGQPKIEQQYRAPVGRHLDHEPCLIKTHFGIWVIFRDSIRYSLCFCF